MFILKLIRVNFIFIFLLLIIRFQLIYLAMFLLWLPFPNPTPHFQTVPGRMFVHASQCFRTLFQCNVPFRTWDEGDLSCTEHSGGDMANTLMK